MALRIGTSSTVTPPCRWDPQAPVGCQVVGSPGLVETAFEAARKLPSNIVFGKVGAMAPPPKVANADRRSREHLTPAEIDRWSPRRSAGTRVNATLRRSCAPSGT